MITFIFLLFSNPKIFDLAWVLCGDTEFMAKIYPGKINSGFPFPLGVIGNSLFGKEGSPVASYVVQILSV